jgi:hypothetical protein
MKDTLRPPVQISLKRERHLVRLLMAFLICGIVFVVLPGTFLGVWNLFAISGSQNAESLPQAWIQAHGHAQVFGWIGSFILGIGFYAMPNLRRVSAWSYWDGWLIWSTWTLGCALRWFANVYLWNWQVLVPLSAVLELAAVVVFVVRSMQGHRAEKAHKSKVEPWATLVISGTAGLLAVMVLNLYECLLVATTAKTPAFPPSFDSAFLVAAIWSFPAPIAWGFTAHWMPVFLGLKPTRGRLVPISLMLVVIGCVAAFVGQAVFSASVLLGAVVSITVALRIFEPSDTAPKIQGVHPTFPLFIRFAYAWQLIAAILLVWAAAQPALAGLGGAGRHAITVGFLMTMVFSVGPRMLPAFLGRKKLFSETLMFAALVLSNTGCLLRVSSEIVAYGHSGSVAWMLLPVSATLELTAVVVFAFNMIKTFMSPPLLPAA